MVESSGYDVGVDIGTTWTAAAIARDRRVQMAHLGTDTAAIPTLIHLTENGDIEIGDTALRANDPTNTARNFKRDLGTDTTITLRNTTYTPDGLLARILRHTIDLITEREGTPPDNTVITHPANWDPTKTQLLKAAVERANIPNPHFLTEPEAAAIAYASRERVPNGTTIAVYDLGGGTFDASVLRKTANGFTTLGTSHGTSDLGGLDFDATIHNHLNRHLSGALDQLDPQTHAEHLTTINTLCTQAREELTTQTETTIDIDIPTTEPTTIRITRNQFDAMIRPAINQTVRTLQRTITSSDLTPTDIDTILLVGGASRTPLVAELITNATNRPVTLDDHPKYATALGAAIEPMLRPAAAAAATATAARPAATPATAAVAAAAPVDDDADATVAMPVAAAAAAAPAARTPVASTRSAPRSSSRDPKAAIITQDTSPAGAGTWRWVVAAALVLLGGLVVANVLGIFDNSSNGSEVLAEGTENSIGTTPVIGQTTLDTAAGTTVGIGVGDPDLPRSDTTLATDTTAASDTTVTSEAESSTPTVATPPPSTEAPTTTENPANIDADGDGFTPTRGDCDDSNDQINPNAVDRPANGIDEDCDGSDAVRGPRQLDQDEDGFTPNQGDCDDFDSTTRPGALDVAGDGIDQDCDGSDAVPQPNRQDQDGDGFTPNQGDCDDLNDTVNPNANDIPGDGIDQNCDGADAQQNTTTTAAAGGDLDGDGFTVAQGDCNDQNNTIFPGAPDNPDDPEDKNCDGAP